MDTLPKTLYTPWEGPFRVSWIYKTRTMLHPEQVSQGTWNLAEAKRLMRLKHLDPNVIMVMRYIHLRPKAAPQMVESQDRYDHHYFPILAAIRWGLKTR